MNNKGVENKIKKKLEGKTESDLLGFQSQIDNASSLLKSIDYYSVVPLLFLKALELTEDQIDKLIDRVLGETLNYWPIRIVLKRAIQAGQLRLEQLRAEKLKNLMKDKSVLASLIKAIVAKKSPINNLIGGKTAQVQGNISNELKEIGMKPYNLLPVIKSVLNVEIPKEGESAVYESLMQDLITILDSIDKLTDKDVAAVMRKFSLYLDKLRRDIDTIIQKKQQVGGSSILKRMNRLNHRDLNQIRKKMGGRRFNKVLEKCGCQHPREMRAIQKKLSS